MDSEMEIWGAERKKELFEEVFDLNVPARRSAAFRHAGVQFVV